LSEAEAQVPLWVPEVAGHYWGTTSGSGAGQ